MCRTATYCEGNPRPEAAVSDGASEDGRASARQSASGDEGDDDIGGVTVEVLAPAVIHRGRPRVGVPGGELDVSEGDPGVGGPP
jgi:hypothetical protein